MRPHFSSITIEHNELMTFSTNDNPNKSKTKCTAFLKKKRTLKNMTLSGKNLPWVESAKHLGNTIANNIDGMSQDIIEESTIHYKKQ